VSQGVFYQGRGSIARKKETKAMTGRYRTGVCWVIFIALAATIARDSFAAEKPSQPPPKPAYRSVCFRDVPHVVQKPDFCGEACVEMWLQKLGRKLTQDDVFNASGLDPLEGRGCHTKELAKAMANLGFHPGPVWHPAAAADKAEQAEKQWQALHADLLAGVPSIVCMYSDGSPRATEHFRLVLGYDSNTDLVLFHEPAQAGGAYQRMPRTTLLALWPLSAGEGKATIIRLRLESSSRATPPAPRPSSPGASFSPADYAQHMMKLKPKIPGKGFTVVLAAPFVVIGDGPAEEVRRRAKDTVQWAVEKLKAEYFAKDPQDILDIWLFKGKESYEKHCLSLFRKKPDTPFGYYSHTDRALVMNIDTGGGTLVHEIVHPFVAANFPNCPSWLNEGLGSLYEQCGEKDGRIHGYPNWRLPALQEAIRKKSVPSFQSLMALSEYDFYEKDKGTNYAQSRYLCYYLQQQGLLKKFYHRFLADRQKDPTGYETLKTVLKRDDMAAFQKEWEEYTLKLKFR
jgi:hypothetical protein